MAFAHLKPKKPARTPKASARRGAQAPVRMHDTKSADFFGRRVQVAANESTDEHDARTIASSIKRGAPAQRQPAESRDSVAASNVALPSGRPLARSLGTWAENTLGGDFSDVRVHDDPLAHNVANRLHARALTLGNHIFFDKREFRPHDISGRALLAHELWHTRQSNPGAPMLRLERKAELGMIASPEYAFFIDRALDGQYFSECDLAMLDLQSLSELIPVIEQNRDQYGIFSTEYQRLDELLTTARAVLMDRDELLLECTGPMGPPAPSAAPKQKDAPAKRSEQAQPAPREKHKDPAARSKAPAPSAPQPKSYFSHSHAIVYKAVREGKIPSFENVHRIVEYEYGGVSWGFADDLLSIARESKAAAKVAYQTLNGLADAGYNGYFHKVERFLEDDLLTVEEMDIYDTGTPEWPNVEFQERAARAVGGRTVTSPKSANSSKPNSPDSGKPKSPNSHNLKVSPSGGEITFDLGAYRLSVGLSAALSVKEAQAQGGASVGGSPSGTSVGANAKISEDASASASLGSSTSGDRTGSAGAKVSTESLGVDETISRVIETMAISVNEKGIPTLSLGMHGAGPSSTTVDFKPTSVTVKYTFSKFESQITLPAQGAHTLSGSLTISLKLEVDPDIGGMPVWAHAYPRGLTMVEGLGIATAVVVIVVAAPLVAGAAGTTAVVGGFGQAAGATGLTLMLISD